MLRVRDRAVSDASFVGRKWVPVVVCTVAVLCYAVPLLEGRLIANPKTVWPLWPNCAILVAGMMFVERRIWPVLIAASFAVTVVVDLRIGLTIKSIAWFILADTVEVVIAAYGLRYWFGGVPQLDSVVALAKYSLFAVLLGPFSAAFLSANGVGRDYWAGWKICFLSEALAFVTVTPVILSWGRQLLTGNRRSRAYYLECAVQLAGLFAVSFLAFTSSQQQSLPVQLYALLPFLLWAALRLGATGVNTSIVVVCFLTVWGAVHGRGPFAVQGPIQDPWSIQVFLVFAATLFMILNAVVEERQRTQALLSNVSGRLIHAQEQERARIARELHDDIGQRMAIASITISQVQGSLSGADSIARERMAEVGNQMIQISSELQSLSHELHSSTLDYLGLPQAAKSWCQQVAQRRQTEIVFNSHDCPRSLPHDVSLCVFRILQEAVHNSCKHSEAVRIEVELWGDSSAVHLKVSDSGKGFDTSTKSLSKGLGLTSMHERARMLQGKVHIVSKPMSGTAIVARIPLNQR